jgi:hypothetical protein
VCTQPIQLFVRQPLEDLQGSEVRAGELHAGTAATSGLVQVLMHVHHSHRSFADR